MRQASRKARRRRWSRPIEMPWRNIGFAAAACSIVSPHRPNWTAAEWRNIRPFRFSANALTATATGSRHGASRSPKPSYDVIIIGGGGHGLSTAYYLAKEHGITNVAVLEKGWLGSGNVGRNTTIVRSNYLLPESSASTSIR